MGRLAAVLGGAPCVWEDVERLEAMTGGDWPGLWVAVNDVGVHWPRRLDAWATLHPEKLVVHDDDHPDGLPWARQRHEKGHPGGCTTYARRRPDLVHETVEHWGGGSSGFYAVAVCKSIGADRVVLCGCPLDDSGAFEESEATHTVAAHLDDYRQAWERRIRLGGEPAECLTTCVRSLSGWTRELLGAPTEEWLAVTAHVSD